MSQMEYNYPSAHCQAKTTKRKEKSQVRVIRPERPRLLSDCLPSALCRLNPPVEFWLWCFEETQNEWFLHLYHQLVCSDMHIEEDVREGALP